MHFLTTRAGWKVTRIYDHYIFKQARFKRELVVMNQDARKVAKTKVEKDFYKLLNNSNFGDYYSCKLELIFDGLDEITYIKKFTNILFDGRYREFFSLDLLRQQVEREFKKKKEKLHESNPLYHAILETIEKEKRRILKPLNATKKRKKRKFTPQSIDTIENKINGCLDIRKNIMVIEFNDYKSASVKSIAVT